MALLNRFSKLNDRAETGIFTFIVTKSVTRDFHRDATTKDFCFGYHRWAISFQRPNERVLGVHLLLRNPSPNTSCLVDFTLTLLNREHFSQNEVYSKRQAKFTITNPMQGVARWIQMSDLTERHFSNETGEFLFELSLSNMSTIFECDIQLSPNILTQYKSMLKSGLQPGPPTGQQQEESAGQQQQSRAHSGRQTGNSGPGSGRKNSELINLETNYFTFGAFDWSLTIVPLVVPGQSPPQPQQLENSSNTSSSSSSNTNLLTPNKQLSSSSLSIASNNSSQQQQQQTNSSNNKRSVQHKHQQQQPPAGQQLQLEPVCRVYLNRLNGFDCLCRVKYRVILGHHQPGSPHPAEFVDSRLLDQISDSGGRIRGHQFRHTNILKLISLRSSLGGPAAGGGQTQPLQAGFKHHQAAGQQQQQNHSSSSLDLRVHIEMFCANTVSEARVPMQRRPNEAQVSNCSDRNKQAWCVESDSENENVRLKLFFMDLQSVPRNHIRYISWIAYIVRRDSKTGAVKESIAVRNSPHSNYYLQDGIDMGTLMDTDLTTKELAGSPKAYLADGNQLTVHIEWVDSLLLFSHLYNNYDSLATVQRHQIRRELSALQQEYELLERKYLLNRRALNQLLDSGCQPAASSGQLDYQVQATGHSAPETAGSQVAAASCTSNQQQQQPQQSGNGRRQSSSTRKSSAGVSAEASAGPVQQPHWSHGALAALDGTAALTASAVAAISPQQLMSAAVGQPHRKTPPMSLDERLKFSSSTPPGRAHHHHHGGRGHHSPLQTEHHHHQAGRLSDSPTHHQQLRLSSAGSARRRLPAQPALQAHNMGVADTLAGTISGSCQLLDGQQQLMFGSAAEINTQQLHDNSAAGQQPIMVGAAGGDRLSTAAASAHSLARHARPMANQQQQQLDLSPSPSPQVSQLVGGGGQAEDEQVDRYGLELAAYHQTHLAASGQAHRSSSIPAQQAAPTGGQQQQHFALYERMLVRPAAGEQMPPANHHQQLELEMEMEALYVAAGGRRRSGSPSGSLEQQPPTASTVEELVLEARRESGPCKQQQVGGLILEALARSHEVASFAPSVVEHQLPVQIQHQQHHHHNQYEQQQHQHQYEHRL